MYRNIKNSLVIAGILISAGISAQQQSLYTNYLLNQYVYNPAYAGVEDGTQFNLGYRNQWLGFEGGPVTYMVSGYGKFKKRPNMAAGGLVITEKIGLLQRTSFYATYSYHLKINKKAGINFGLGAGGIQHRVRMYDARPYDKDDHFLSSDVLRAMAFDANAGFYFYSKNFFLGFSNQHMPNSRIHWDKSQGRNTSHFYGYTGYSFHLNKSWMVQPSVLIRTNSPVPYQLEYNARVVYDDMFWAGLSYRHKSSAAFMFGCKLDKQYTFAYSYDMALTAISKYSSGSHEIVLSYLIPYKKKKSKSDIIKDADEEELNKIDNSIKTSLRNKKKKENEKKTEEEEKKKTNSDDVKPDPSSGQPAETDPEAPAPDEQKIPEKEGESQPEPKTEHE
jgi:type IX secretion system PorP/SprF family membrane protein